MDIEKLQARLEALLKKRDNFLQEANREIAFKNGRIAELETLINELAQPEEPAKDGAE